MSPRESWREQAACRDMPITVFFPTNEQGHQCAYARQVCGRCPVQVDCLAAAVAEERTYGGQGSIHGMRGGKTPAERWRYVEGTRRECLMCDRPFHPLDHRERYCCDGCRWAGTRAHQRRTQAERSARYRAGKQTA